jgi:CheY-like chemotaxis protein
MELEADTVEQDNEPTSGTTNNLTQLQKCIGHVLVAEDNKTCQVAMKEMLEKLGLEVMVANDGREVIEKVRQQSFDLIFMDIGMPHLGGYHTTRALREQGVRVPIIAVTGKEMKHDGEECIRAGCDEYLAKPITHIGLQMMIDKYLYKS